MVTLAPPGEEWEGLEELVLSTEGAEGEAENGDEATLRMYFSFVFFLRLFPLPHPLSFPLSTFLVGFGKKGKGKPH